MWLKIAKYIAGAVAVVATIIYFVENVIVRILTGPFSQKPGLSPYNCVLIATGVILFIGLLYSVVVGVVYTIIGFIRYVFFAKEAAAEPIDVAPVQNDHPYNTRSKTRAKKIIVCVNPQNRCQ